MPTHSTSHSNVTSSMRYLQNTDSMSDMSTHSTSHINVTNAMHHLQHTDSRSDMLTHSTSHSNFTNLMFTLWCAAQACASVYFSHLNLTN